MRILHLTLKKRWFDLIASGEKKEEYREVKEYWNTRFNYADLRNGKIDRLFLPRKFDVVVFTNGYRRDSKRISLECNGILVGGGNPDWGAEPGKEYFVIKLGKIIDR